MLFKKERAFSGRTEDSFLNFDVPVKMDYKILIIYLNIN